METVPDQVSGNISEGAANPLDEPDDPFANHIVNQLEQEPPE